MQYQGNTVRAGCVKGRNFRTRTPFWVFFGADCTRLSLLIRVVEEYSDPRSEIESRTRTRVPGRVFSVSGGRVFSWINGRLGPVGHANLKIMQSTQAGISRPCGNALWTHGTDHSSKFPHRRQNTGLCDDLSCRGGERPHLSNTPSRRITDERDTGFHWALRRGGWGRTPVGNPSLGACLPLLCPSMSCADSLCTYVQFLLPPRGEGAKKLPVFSANCASGFFPVSVDRVVPGFRGPGFSRVWWWSLMKSVSTRPSAVSRPFQIFKVAHWLRRPPRLHAPHMFSHASSAHVLASLAQCRDRSGGKVRRFSVSSEVATRLTLGAADARVITLGARSG